MRLAVDIKKRLGSFCLHVAFACEDGVLGILGASGCGKSMTLKCIAGIEKPDRGTITLDGRVLFDIEKHINLTPQQRRVGYPFQQYALFPNMTVAQNICVVPKLLKADKAKCDEIVRDLLKMVNMEAYADKYPSELSGGQQQRIGDQRALAASPPIVLMD